MTLNDRAVVIVDGYVVLKNLRKDYTINTIRMKHVS